MAWTFLGKFKDKICNAQDRRSGEMANYVYVIYKNSVVPHVKHMFQTASDMAMENMCAYP